MSGEQPSRTNVLERHQNLLPRKKDRVVGVRVKKGLPPLPTDATDAEILQRVLPQKKVGRKVE